MLSTCKNYLIFDVVAIKSICLLSLMPSNKEKLDMKLSRNKVTSFIYISFFQFLLSANIPVDLNAQTGIVDSLKKLLVISEEDSNKVDILNNLCAELIDSSQLTEAKRFADDALSLAQKVNDKVGESVALVNLGNAFADEGNSDEALRYYQQALNIREALKRKKGMAECLNNIGITLWAKSQFSEALKNHTRALSLREELKDTMGMAFSYQNIGNVFIEMGLYPNAVENYLNALKIFERKGVRFRVADNYNNLGAVYWHQKDYNESVKSFQKCLEILNELNIEQRTSNTLSNIGNVYLEQNKFPEAIQYYRLALDVQEKYKDVRGISNSYLNIGAVFQKENKHDSALKYFFRSLNLALEQKNQDGISAAQLNIGISYRNQKKYKLAGSYVNRSLSISKEINMIERIRDTYEEMSVLAGIQGNWEEAFNNYKTYVTYRDSLLDEKSIIETVQLRERYEYDKQKELDALINENKLALMRDRVQNQRTIWLIAFLSLLIIGFFSINFMIKRKDYRFEQKIAEVKQEALNAQMSGHFISNTVDSINSFMEANDKEKASEYLLLFHRLIRRVLRNSFQKLVPLESDLGVLQGYFELEKLRFKESSLTLDVNINDEIDPQNTLIPPMIFQTVVENSIKHAFKKLQGGIIKISIKESLGVLECAVEDNGMGRNASKLSKEERQGGETSYGSGLAERLVTISGGFKGKSSYKVIDLLDQEGKAAGTRVEFKLPIISN